MNIKVQILKFQYKTLNLLNLYVDEGKGKISKQH